MNVVLISTYDLGRQPFGLASPAAWLRRAGHEVTCVDLSLSPLPSLALREAGLVAFFLPMHTATRLAAQVVERVRALNSAAHLCAYGLYAPLNAEYLRGLGVHSILGGEPEQALVDVASGLTPATSIPKLQFVRPDRSGLPILSRYPKLRHGSEARVAGYTEASRGCKHLCRHCPVVPVYHGSFRVVDADVVLADVAAQVSAGAQHISFGDPDFFNGPAHARRIVERVHRDFPALSYDVTVKVEHLLRHRNLLPVLRDTGCLFVTSAVESLEDHVLRKLEKGHTRADFFAVYDRMREAGLTLTPTFIPFTPWTTERGYRDLIDTVARLDLIDNVPPLQLALRLLIPNGSRLLELDDVRSRVTGYDAAALAYRWTHEDPCMDALASRLMEVVQEGRQASRRETFAAIWAAVHGRPLAEDYSLLPRTIIPFMEEPWFC